MVCLSELLFLDAYVCYFQQLCFTYAWVKSMCCNKCRKLHCVLFEVSFVNEMVGIKFRDCVNCVPSLL